MLLKVMPIIHSSYLANYIGKTKKGPAKLLFKLL